MVSESDGENRSDTTNTFADFYTATVERSFATAVRLAGDREIAYDVVQDAYVVMLERWEHRESRALDDNRRYVVAIVAHKVADWYRRSKRFVRWDDNDDPPVDEAGYDRALDELSSFKVVHEVLESQPVRRRMIGILYFLEEFEYAEIGAALGITTSTVRTQVARLRSGLMPLLKEGGDHR
ncbi:RNA polymerase sigma factor [Nocardia wallacei]|uniref:RNA polymerase sigma factor n=1 Tax=Nocardia wallacei TaxID=480035 RepID=UPI002455DB9A|nr:sigma-70 family RNA polymerase sigma factor [Nocardia wallacei]